MKQNKGTALLLCFGILLVFSSLGSVVLAHCWFSHDSAHKKSLIFQSSQNAATVSCV